MYWLDKINAMKKEKCFTTEDISRLSCIPKGTLNKIFAGQTKDPQLGTIKAIVHCMGYTLDDLDENKKIISGALDTTSKVFTEEEQELINIFRKLNNEGKQEVIDHLDYILTKAKYTKCD